MKNIVKFPKKPADWLKVRMTGDCQEGFSLSMTMGKLELRGEGLFPDDAARLESLASVMMKHAEVLRIADQLEGVNLTARQPLPDDLPQ